MSKPKTIAAEPTYLTSGQVVRRLGVSRQTISILVRSGKLKAIRPNVHFRFDQKELEKFIQARKRAA
jgi:excisionase family DNA binding protein